MEVSIPNAVLATDKATNYTRLAGGKGVILNTTVSIEYSTPWRKVHELLILASKRTPGLVQNPPPIVRQTALSALHANIQDVFNEHGEQIMSPHYVSAPHRRYGHPGKSGLMLRQSYPMKAQKLDPS